MMSNITVFQNPVTITAMYICKLIKYAWTLVIIITYVYVAIKLTCRFSMRHDGDGNDCPTDSDRIMDAVLGGESRLFQWSRCSAAYLNIFLK